MKNLQMSVLFSLTVFQHLPQFFQWGHKYYSFCGKIQLKFNWEKLLSIQVWLGIYYSLPIGKYLKAEHYIVFLFRYKWV